VWLCALGVRIRATEKKCLAGESTVFERSLPDDSAAAAAKALDEDVETVRAMNGITRMVVESGGIYQEKYFFLVRFEVAPGSPPLAEVFRRFSDFDDLRNAILDVASVRKRPRLPSLPPKHFFKKGDDPRVIAERVPGLQAILDAIVKNERGELAHEATKEFINADIDTRENPKEHMVISAAKNVADSAAKLASGK